MALKGYLLYRSHKGSEGEMTPRKGKGPNKLKSAGWSVGSGGTGWKSRSTWRTLFVAVLFLLLSATTLKLGQVFDGRLHPAKLSYVATHVLPTARSIVLDTPVVVPHSSGLVEVRDIVAFPDEVMLLVGAVGGAGALLPSKQDLQCLFGKTQRTGVYTVEWKDETLRTILAVRCEHPPEALTDSREATLLLTNSNFAVPSAVEYVTNSSWKPLVYETVSLEDSVLLFAKGLVDSQGRPDNYSKSLDKLHCLFGKDIQTRVRVVAQEVVRCELPLAKLVHQLVGVPISLFVPKMGVLPTVAYFNLPPNVSQPTKKRFHICACTMLWNQAQFLREWILYHGFLGIERWYLYDNNSDDEIEEVLEGLQGNYNITRHVWPWIKTQEAGFSHCALRAKADCDWVLFADVDEFVYPNKDLRELFAPSVGTVSLGLPADASLAPSLSASKVKTPKSAGVVQVDYSKLGLTWEQLSERMRNSSTSVLRRMIRRVLKKGESQGKKIGEVRLVCHNFGPSGLSRPPQDGVTVGYTCRMQWPQRHKSFIYLDAISDSLLNVVHHFALRDGYKEMAVHARVAVINHYKYQAWEVFKAKFVRRVATYVVDWREQTALSNDRAPGLGLEAVEPPDWPTRYCEEVDWGLRNFTWNAFRHPETQRMAWAL